MNTTSTAERGEAEFLRTSVTAAVHDKEQIGFNTFRTWIRTKTWRSSFGAMATTRWWMRPCRCSVW